MTFFDEGNIVGVSFGKALSKIGRKNPTSIWRGVGKVFGDFVEWRVDDRGIPRAAILRTWQAGMVAQLSRATASAARPRIAP